MSKKYFFYGLLVFVVFLLCFMSKEVKNNVNVSKEKKGEICSNSIETEGSTKVSQEILEIEFMSETMELTSEYYTINQSEYTHTNNEIPQYIQLYSDFLNQKKAVISNDEKMYIKQLEGLNAEFDKLKLEYALFDMNYDNIPELHLRCPWYYIIITISNNELKLWREASTYERPLENGALLYERSGGGPTHIDYSYTTMKYNGETKYEVSFSKYDDNMDDIYDERDRYFIDSYNIGNTRIEVNKSKWDKEIKKFLAIKDAPIKWYTISFK